MNNDHSFQINVGFLIHSPVGTYREFPAETDSIVLDDEGTTAKNIIATIRVNKVQQGILAEVDAEAETEMECIRCLEPFTQKLHTHFEELFSFHIRGNEEADQYLPENGVMSLLPLLREDLLIEIPISPICKPECKGLCPICGQNLNLKQCSHPKEDFSD